MINGEEKEREKRGRGSYREMDREGKGGEGAREVGRKGKKEGEGKEREGEENYYPVICHLPVIALLHFLKHRIYILHMKLHFRDFKVFLGNIFNCVFSL